MPRLAAALAILLFSFHGAAVQGQPQCPASTKPPRAKVKPSPSNPQYVFYNGRTQALVGVSPSYLCHIEQPGSFGNPAVTPSVDYCEFTNYRDYLTYLSNDDVFPNSIPREGLNTIRLWIGLNHSPGIQRHGTPYPYEFPFQRPYNTNGAPDEVFFARLQCVLDHAWSLDQIVEITIFDPWEGTFSTSPWNVYFQNKNCFASKSFVLPNGQTCESDPTTGPQNRAGWNKQKELITQLVTRFCSYPNIYYEIANEVDLTVGGMAPDKIQSWHQEMTNHLTTTENNLACGHFVGANFHNPANVDGLSTTFKAINAHYAYSPDAAKIAAIELLRTRHNGGALELDRIFGFNETKITSFRSLVSSGFTFQTAEAARAEAWEFMLSEGGVYNLYGERWNMMESDTPIVTNSLKTLNALLTLAKLDRVRRSQSVNDARPTWIGNSSSLPGYGGTNNTRWGAMHSPMTQAGDANFLYIHHSTLEGSGAFQRYKPVIRSSTSPYPAQSIYAILPLGSYRAEWIEPDSGYIVGAANFMVTVANAQTLVPAAKTYRFDIALRITRL